MCYLTLRGAATTQSGQSALIRELAVECTNHDIASQLQIRYRLNIAEDWFNNGTGRVDFEIHVFMDPSLADLTTGDLLESLQIRSLSLECAESALHPPNAPLKDLVAQSHPDIGVLSRQFLRMTIERSCHGKPYRILDIGGRSRSKIDRSKDFPGSQVTVLDIVKGDNVDVVGDAHCLSDIFEPDSFDAVFSCSVFEHLAMPWKVSLEINRILRLGGLLFIHTHQTIGIHDKPWDFWRFSDDSWDSLLNSRTGFRIISTRLEEPMWIVPHFYSCYPHGQERGTGMMGSSVLAEKISSGSSLEWNVALREFTSTFYPVS